MTEEIIINEKSLQAVLKRYDELEQENKELKEKFNAFVEHSKTESDKVYYKMLDYKTALEEIRELAEKSLKISYNLEVNSMLYDIKHKINEVLGNESN